MILSVLAHLDERDAMTAGNLARHLGIGASTLSATLNRLVKLGYITRTPAAADRRIVELRLSKTGARAMQGSSVLESARVAALLDELDARRAATRTRRPRAARARGTPTVRAIDPRRTQDSRGSQDGRNSDTANRVERHRRHRRGGVMRTYSSRRRIIGALVLRSWPSSP